MAAGTRKPESEQFKRFFAAYPKRSPNPRYAAWCVFEGLVMTGDDPEALIGAAGRFAGECKAKALDPKFVPHARTWLSQRRFEDYREPEAPAAEAGTGTAPDLRREPVDGRLNGVMTAIEQRAWLVAVRIEGDRAVIVTRSRVGADKVRTSWGERIAAALDVARVAYEVQR